MSSSAVSDNELLVEVDGHVAIITLNRPNVGNAFNLNVKNRLVEVWDWIAREKEVRSIVFTGTGKRHFCTGVDLNDVANEGTRERGSDLRRSVRLTARQNGVWKPIVCAVNGVVAGAGLHFVADADIVVASHAVEFVDTHVSVGLVSGLESIGLAQRMPLGAVLRMALMGSHYRMSAERAHQLGLVDELTDENDLLDVSIGIASAIAKNSPSATALTQQAIWGSLGVPRDEAMQLAWALVQLQWSHPDYREGPRAFVEKRSPNWGD